MCIRDSNGTDQSTSQMDSHSPDFAGGADNATALPEGDYEVSTVQPSPSSLPQCSSFYAQNLNNTTFYRPTTKMQAPAKIFG